MWRRLHRWFGLVTGLLFSVVSLTGIGMQVVSLVSPEHDGPPPFEDTSGKAGDGAQSHAGGPPAAGMIVNPEGGEARPEPGGPGPHDQRPDFYHWLDHIHDGEFAGPAGRVVSLILGLALFFFSVSGLWMYWTMFRNRARAGQPGLFW